MYYTFQQSCNLESRFYQISHDVFIFSMCTGKVFQFQKMCYPDYVGVYSTYIYKEEINRVCVESSGLDCSV